MDVKDGSSEFVSISPDTTNQADEKKSNVPDDNSLIADFETPEEYLLHYARTGNSAKLSQLFDVIRDESAELDLNAKGKQKSNRGWTALHLASYFGHLDVVKLLLEKKASVNVTNDTGDSPLHKAAFVGRTDIVQLLLAHHADVSMRNQELQTARQLARSTQVADLLAQVELSDRRRREARFLQSAREGEMDALRNLLSGQLPVNVNCCDESGNTALHVAAIQNQKQVIAFLLQQPGIDSSAKNKSGQIPATLAPNHALKRLLLDVQPINDSFTSGGGGGNSFGLSTTSGRQQQAGQPDRFEGSLLRRTRFVVWRRVWAVLDRGGLALYSTHADAVASRRRLLFAFLHAASVESADTHNTFTLHLDKRARLVLQVPNSNALVNLNESCASNSPGNELRRAWCEAVERHIEFARRLVVRGICSEADSEDEVLPSDRISGDSTTIGGDRRPVSEDRVQSLLDTAHAHLGVLTRHLRGLKQLVEEDLQHVQSTLPDGLSVECSRAVMHCMKRFWPTLTFHLNFVQESAQHTNEALQHCVKVMDRQYKLQQLQLHEANEKVRTLEEIVHVLAQQQHDFERSMGQQRQSHYQSPLRLSASAHPTDSVASDSECEEFFDAFEDETEEQLEDLDAQSAELSNQSSSEQPIDQSDQSPELISDSRLR